MVEEDIETGRRKSPPPPASEDSTPVRRTLSRRPSGGSIGGGSSGGNGANGGVDAEKRGMGMLRSSTNRSASGGSSGASAGGGNTLTTQGAAKLVGILKKSSQPAPALGMMGRKQTSFIGRPKPLGRAPSSMSTRFLMTATNNKTVRFRLESERDSSSWLAQRTQPLDPRSLFLTRWKSLCIAFLSISFFRLPVIIAFGAHGLWMDYLWYVRTYVRSVSVNSCRGT